MRKKKNEGVFIAKANKVMIDGQEFTGDLSQIEKAEKLTFNFETALDFIVFSFSLLINNLKDRPIDDSLRIKNLDYAIQMRDFFSTRITDLKISPSPDSPIPYKYDIAYKAVGDETREQVEQKIKEYLHSQLFNLILARVDPRIMEIFNKQAELAKKEAELAKKEAELKKKEGKTGKFKRSGHLTDQILQYNYPVGKNKQLSIFDKLNQSILEKIEQSGIEKKEIVEGIRLSPAETKVIDCLCKLLHETSQNSDPGDNSYYSGNMDFELVEYGEEKSTPAPKLAFTLYELTREYKGGEYVSGKDIDNVKQILTDLDSKKFLLSYVETAKKLDGGRIERKIEDFRKLIHIVKISQTEYSKEDIELSRQEETVIILNPIFRRQIDSKFILYPNDINRRTIIAYGSHNLSDIALRLRDYLMREHSSGRFTPQIGVEKLYYLLAEKWMKESRKKKVKEYTDKAIETVKNLGLLLSYEIKPASTGEQKVVFYLDKNWE